MNSEEGFDPDISRLYQSRPKAAPSAEIDAAIIAQAKEVLTNSVTSPGASRRSWQRWLLPLSTAALLVMGISVTIKIMNQPESSYQLSLPTTESTSGRDAEYGDGHEKVFKEEAAGESAQSTAPPAAVMMFEAAPEAESGFETDEMRQDQKLAAPIPRRRSLERVEQRELLKRTMPDKAKSIRPQERDSEMDDARGLAPTESLGVELGWSTPEAWLNHIEQLLKDNQMEEARIELERFRKKYPDYVIPEVLQELLG